MEIPRFGIVPPLSSNTPEKRQKYKMCQKNGKGVVSMSELEKELTDMQGGWYGWDNVRLYPRKT